MRKFILGATAALAVATGQVSAQGLPTQNPAPVVPATGGTSPFTPVGGGDPVGGAPIVPAGPVGDAVYPVGDVVYGGYGGRGGYVEASYLLMFLSSANTAVPLATGGPSLGILGQPGTTVLLGDPNADYDTSSGIKLTAGSLLGDSRIGFEWSGFYLGKTTSDTAIGPTSAIVIARPFFDPATRRENAKIVAAPGAFNGGVAVDNAAQIWGFEANPFWRLNSGSPFTLDGIVGFRFFRHTETLNIYDASNLLAGGVSAFNGIGIAAPGSIAVHDRFHVQNNFYGGNLGARVGFGRGGLFLDLTGKIALGAVTQLVDVDGSTTLVQGPLVAPTTTSGGFLATGANLGQRSETRFAVLPEGDVKLGYQFGPSLNAFVGYSVMYLSSAARPADQISRTVSLTQLPTSPTYNARPVTGQVTPEIVESDLWLHGFQFGVTWTY